MKRYICIILAIATLMLICSCTSESDEIKNPVTYYYQSAKIDYNSPDGVVKAEIRDSRGHVNDFRYLIEQYLNGPRNYECFSPFPAGTTLEEFDMDEQRVSLILSSHMTTLSGAELMFACACMTKTVIVMTGVTSVQIGTINGTLNGQETITMTADSFVLIDESHLPVE